jgi:hypothetical protein
MQKVAYADEAVPKCIEVSRGQPVVHSGREGEPLDSIELLSCGEIANQEVVTGERIDCKPTLK